MSCECGHDERRVPETREEALELAGHAGALLEVVARDNSRWLGVLRCRECGRYWAEDSMSSGHADLFFVYPIVTDDAERWLAEAQPLHL